MVGWAVVVLNLLSKRLLGDGAPASDLVHVHRSKSILLFKLDLPHTATTRSRLRCLLCCQCHFNSFPDQRPQEFQRPPICKISKWTSVFHLQTDCPCCQPSI